jgi:hypothetical protein
MVQSMSFSDKEATMAHKIATKLKGIAGIVSLFSLGLALGLATPAAADDDKDYICSESQYWCDEWNNILYYIQVHDTGHTCWEEFILLGACEQR